MTETTAVRIDLYESSPGVLLRQRELAAALHASCKTLRYGRARNRGPRFRCIEGQVRYRAGDVVQWLEQNRGQAPHPLGTLGAIRCYPRR